MLDPTPPDITPSDLPDPGDLGEHPPTLIAPPAQARTVATADYVAATGPVGAFDAGLLTDRLLDLSHEIARVTTECQRLQDVVLDALDAAVAVTTEGGDACD